jgi:hypothetical protein
MKDVVDAGNSGKPRVKARFAAPGTSGEAAEVQTRITCRGKSAAAVLDELSHALADAEVRKQDPLIVLEDLALLQDSVMTFIKALSRLLANYPRTVTFWEFSGYTEAFLTVMEKQGS